MSRHFTIPAFRLLASLIGAASIAAHVAAQTPPDGVADREIRTSTIKWPANAQRGAWSPSTWPGGVVPFAWDPGVSLANQAAMAQAMIELSRVANISSATAFMASSSPYLSSVSAMTIAPW